MERLETLGPAERIIQTLTTFVDHMVHNRSGVFVADATQAIGGKWHPASYQEENGVKTVYKLEKVGRKQTRTPFGVLSPNGDVKEGNRKIAEYRQPGLFPEVAAYIYKQIAEVWKLDNEFVAKWASYAFEQEHRDLKVALAAFMLVQNRFGEPVREAGEILFFDEDYREVGEAMCLIRRKDNKDLNPKLLLRVGEFLRLPQIAQINRELGFGNSPKNPTLGRWTKVVETWLRYREQNIPMLKGLVNAGYRKTVMELARAVGYKPTSDAFFQTLRWKQKQSVSGHRTIAIGKDVAVAESWEGLTEEQICQRIVNSRPNFKRIVGLIPQGLGLTRAIMAASIEAGSISDTDFIILSPTLEDLGLLEIPQIKDKWKKALENAENQRAANIAKRIRKKETVELLEGAADKATQKAVEEVMKGLRVYVVVDKSGSMEGAIDRAKACLAKFLQAFPLDKLHVSIFNTVGTEVIIRHPSAAGVEQAFKGHVAGGGTVYASGVKVLSRHKPGPDEDAIMIFVGDQADSGHGNFAPTVKDSGINPVAFGVLNVLGTWGTRGQAVEATANILEIPCFEIDEGMFNDPYSVTRILRNLIASTPVRAEVRKVNRKTLVEQILEKPLLKKPVWA